MEDLYFSSSPTDSSIENMYEIPEGFKAHSLLGEGSYGVVLKCRDLKTNKFVAIKVAKHERLRREAYMLSLLMDKDLDQKNIIKFHGGFLRDKCLVFEMLDASLLDYLRYKRGPMRLENIRTVIQQLATALDGLKSLGMVHGDIKINNIMLVDHDRQPFAVKLIDFGLAMFRSMATYKTIRQVHFCRAPEVILGLPLSEAVDIWSLGCVMAIMLFGVPLFNAKDNYELLKQIIELVGPPPNQMISEGQTSHLFFKETESSERKFKTPEEYWGSGKVSTDKRIYTFRCLDETKMLRLEKNNKTEAEDREECIELLKAMLTWDEKERITPSEILAHPFITMSYLNRTCDEALVAQPDSNETTGPSTSQAAQPDPNETTGPSTSQAAQPDPNEKTGPSTSQAAQPDPNETTGPSITQAAQPDPNKTIGPGTSQAVQVHPHDTQQDPGPSIIQAAQPDPSKTTGPGMTQAAQPDPHETQEDTGPSTTQVVQVDPFKTTGPGITQAAQPDPHETQEDTGPSTTQAVQVDPSKTTGPGITQAAQPDHHEIQHDPGPSIAQAAQPLPSKTTGRQQETTRGVITLVRLPTGLILVQPATPQNRIPLGDTSDEESISSCDSSSISDSTPAPAPMPVVNLTNNWPYKEEDKAKKSKKKNCFRRFFSWFKRTACSCCFVDNVAE